jgi:vacuolar protein sorting-associated protein 13A/C
MRIELRRIPYHLHQIFPLISRNVNIFLLSYLQIVDYLDREWSCKHEIQLNAPDFAVWTFDSYDSNQKVSLDLGMNTLTKRGSIVMSLYCPFWMLNKTGVMLTYRVS